MNSVNCVGVAGQTTVVQTLTGLHSALQRQLVITRRHKPDAVDVAHVHCGVIQHLEVRTADGALNEGPHLDKGYVPALLGFQFVSERQ
jgi:hypothetical protein